MADPVRDVGFLLVDKDAGPTSHDVVAAVRRAARVKKVGHAGTLDPAATGLLVLAVGRATRLIRYVQDFAKEYVATALFGVATDTLDADGAVLSREPLPVSEPEVRAVMERFVGPILQVPPMVSALKVDGRRLYDLAREGIEVERAPRQVHVDRLEVVEFAPSDYPEVTFRVVCSKGTYVRTLADDVARALGGRAHLTALRRTRIGHLTVGDAHTVAVVEEAAGRRRLAELLLPPGDALAALPEAVVADEVARGVRHGVAFARTAFGVDAPAAGPFRVVDESGELLAVYRADGNRAVAEVVTV